MNGNLSSYVKKYYPNTKSDLFAVFMDISTYMTKDNGFYAMINQQSWMFLSSFEKLRQFIIDDQTIINMAHTGARTFPEIGGEVVQNTAFVIKNYPIDLYKGRYVRLVTFTNTDEKAKNITNENCTYYGKQIQFKSIPIYPIAYWASENIFNIFLRKKMDSISFSDGQILTGDNDKYLKMLWEVDSSQIRKDGNWMLHAKGGEYRKWAGNIEWVVKWSDSAKKHYKSDKIARFPKEHILFRRGVTWSLISTNSIFGARILTENETFNKAAATILFDDEKYIYFSLAFLNSCVVNILTKIINPTLNNNIKDILAMPLINNTDSEKCINDLAEKNINISKADWDSFETSWDFEKHPLVMEPKFYSKISEAYANWNATAEERFNQLKASEEELNCIFIDIYGLQDELTPEVEDKDVTVRKADVERDVRSFLSYLVGIIFGRYRLDKTGLSFAGGEFNLDEFGSYKPDKDNIIPITAEHYFEDDIVSKIAELVAIIYGEDTLTENLQFIATTLGMKESETAEDTIRRYFMKDFYKDHLKIYQKRPIYWQFSSGKKGAFKGLMYLHRYDKYTLARIRTDYVLKLTTTLNQLIEHAQVIIDGNVSAKEVARARKEREAYEAQLQELREYDLILKQLADQEIDLDLDDGVKVNYAKFQEIPFKKDNGRSEKMNLFEKI